MRACGAASPVLARMEPGKVGRPGGTTRVKPPAGRPMPTPRAAAARHTVLYHAPPHPPQHVPGGPATPTALSQPPGPVHRGIVHVKQNPTQQFQGHGKPIHPAGAVVVRTRMNAFSSRPNGRPVPQTAASSPKANGTLEPTIPGSERERERERRSGRADD